MTYSKQENQYKESDK